MNRFIKSIDFLFILLFLLLITLSSCKKNDNSKTTFAKASTTDSEVVDRGKLVFGSNRAKSKSNAPKMAQQKDFIEIEQGDIKGQLFPLNTQNSIPEDMVIGPLLDFDINNVSVGTFPAAVLSFFREAGKGNINEEVLHPAYIENIKKIFSIDKVQQFYTVRIGKIFKTNGTSSANIRLVSEVGRASGEITADNFKGKWLLSNISIDMEQLKNEYFRETLEYNPVNYSNILLNY